MANSIEHRSLQDHINISPDPVENLVKNKTDKNAVSNKRKISGKLQIKTSSNKKIKMEHEICTKSHEFSNNTNIHIRKLIQRLSVTAENYRLEIAKLNQELISEKAAVRHLRAQIEADVRNFQSERKRTLAQNIKKSETVVLKKDCSNVSEVRKLRQENIELKDNCKLLTEKHLIVCKSDRQKENYVRELKDSFELKISQLNKSTNGQIKHLLQDIKSKDRTIEQLNKRLKNTSVGHISNSRAMQNGNTWKRKNTTHLDEAYLPHQMHERTGNIEINLSLCEKKDSLGSDNDSAVSSAPPSLSPQPELLTSYQNDWQLEVISSQTYYGLKKDYEALKEENNLLTLELGTSKVQIENLQRILYEDSETKQISNASDRISFMEKRIELLLKESYDLREQNELLEFRNLELEEHYEKCQNQRLPEINGKQLTLPSRFDQTMTAKTHDSIIAKIQPYTILENDQEHNLHVNEFQSKCSVLHQCTQTEVPYSNAANDLNGDLSAEIQKLNSFRYKVEQFVTSGKKPLISSYSPEDKKLEYYKDRLNLLENKILVYESSGDLQISLLADRLQREIQLDSWTKQLTNRVQTLVKQNLQLEEEKCEVEEMENDTRLKLQKMEIDIEILKQRNIELETCKIPENSHTRCLSDTRFKIQDRVCILEDYKRDLKNKVENLASFLSSKLQYKSFNLHNEEVAIENAYTNTMFLCKCIRNVESQRYLTPQHEELYELIERERELQQEIFSINRLYNNTLENGRTIWIQLEKEHKDSLIGARKEIEYLNFRIHHFEDRIKSESYSSLEKISVLEERENALLEQISKLSKEERYNVEKLEMLAGKYEALMENYTSLQSCYDQQTNKSADQESKKIKILEEELESANKVLDDVYESHANNLNKLKAQLSNAKTQNSQLLVNNAELREEVSTLENRCMELNNKHLNDDETIRHLLNDLRTKCTQLKFVIGKLENNGDSLVQKLIMNWDSVHPHRNEELGIDQN